MLQFHQTLFKISGADDDSERTPDEIGIGELETVGYSLSVIPEYLKSSTGQLPVYPPGFLFGPFILSDADDVYAVGRHCHGPDNPVFIVAGLNDAPHHPGRSYAVTSHDNRQRSAFTGAECQAECIGELCTQFEDISDLNSFHFSE